MLLDVKAMKLYSRSHKTVINYLNCVWIVFIVRFSFTTFFSQAFSHTLLSFHAQYNTFNNFPLPNISISPTNQSIDLSGIVVSCLIQLIIFLENGPHAQHKHNAWYHALIRIRIRSRKKSEMKNAFEAPAEENYMTFSIGACFPIELWIERVFAVRVLNCM